MIGRLNPDFRKTIIIGAGISGLIAAYRLVQAGHRVQLFDKSSRPGGLISSHFHDNGSADKFLTEAAAHSFLASPEVLKICQELSVDLSEVRPDSKARFILRGGKYRRFPLGIFELLELLFRVFFSRFKNSLSLQDWGRHHLGNAGTEYLLNPFLRGIYSARPNQLSVAMTYPRLEGPTGHSLVSRWIAETITKRLPKPKKRIRSKMMAPNLGMESLVHALVNWLKKSDQCETRFDHPVTAKWIAEQSDANVMFCLPPYALAPLLAEVDPKLSIALQQVKTAKLTTVTMLATNRDFKAGQPPKGVGVLVPERESARSCSGILFNSSAFPFRVTDESIYSSYTMMFPYLLADDDASRIIHSEFKAITGYQGNLQVMITRWDDALPIYGPELNEAWIVAGNGLFRKPGFVWFSNSTGQISIRGLIETPLTAVQSGASI